MSEIPDFETLDEAKAFIRENWKDGCVCPCCGRWLKLYDIKMPGAGAADLIKLYKLSKGFPNHYEHVDVFSNTKSRSFPKLAYWKLCKSMPNDDPEKRTSGMWALTQKGVDFVEGKITVPERTFYYKKKGRGLHGKQVHIIDVLGNKFSYSELMA